MRLIRLASGSLASLREVQQEEEGRVPPKEAEEGERALLKAGLSFLYNRVEVPLVIG